MCSQCSECCHGGSKDGGGGRARGRRGRHGDDDDDDVVDDEGGAAVDDAPARRQADEPCAVEDEEADDDEDDEDSSGSSAGSSQRGVPAALRQPAGLPRAAEEEWSGDGKQRSSGDQSGGGGGGSRDDSELRGRGGGGGGGGGGGSGGRSSGGGRNRDDPRRHTLSGTADHHQQHQHHQHQAMAGRAIDLEMSSKSQRRKSPLPRGYPPLPSAMLFDDDPGIMSEVETSSTGFRRGGKQRSSLPVVRTPSKTLERPLGKGGAVAGPPLFAYPYPAMVPHVVYQPVMPRPQHHHHRGHHQHQPPQPATTGGLVFLQYRSETKRALLPNEITSLDTVKALFVRSFPKQLTMEYLDSPMVKIYIHDSSKDMFYELEDLRSHLREIRDRSVLRLFEAADVNGGVLPGAGVGLAPPPPPSAWDQDQSYFSEPEFDSDYHHQHIHKSKASSKSSGAGAGAYYMTHSYPPGPAGAPGAAATLPRGGAGAGALLRTYSPAVVGPKAADRLHSESGYMSSPERGAPSRGYAPQYAAAAAAYEDPYYSQYAPRSGSITPVIDEEASDTELLDDSYSLYGVKLSAGGRGGGPPGAAPRGPFPPPPPAAAVVPYDATRIRVEHMERQLANLTGLVQKALTQTPTAVAGTVAGGPTPAPRDYAAGTGVQSGAGPGSNAVSTGTSAASAASQAGGRDTGSGGYRNAADEYDKHSSSSSASIPDDSYLRSDTKPPKLGKDKSVSFEKSVSFSDEPPDMNSPKQHSPQHSADSKPTKPAIKSSTLPRMSSQERDRHKPAPPPKPVSLSPGQYDGRHVYRADLQLTPEMYNQLRGLQKKAKDLRQEVRNLRRMSQAQAHSVRETIRDTFIKIRAMLLSGGEEVWAAGGDAEKLRLSREEDLYKQEMLRLEKDLTELESTVEELRGNVINRKTRVNMSDVENMALILSKSSKTVADLKVRFPSLQEGMKSLLSSEMEKVVREEKFLKEEPERLESALRRCKKLTGTLVTLKRLASVQEQRLPPSTTPDSRLSPTPGGGGADSDTPITPPAHGKACTVPARGVMAATIGGGRAVGDDTSRTRPENALDALLDELQTFARPPPPTGVGSSSLSETGRKGSVDSGTSITSTPGGVGLRRLHSYPSSSDSAGDGSGQSGLVSRLQVSAGGVGGTVTDSSQQQRPPPVSPKPPVPERNAELLSQLAGRRVPPPPPPRTSSRSPLASPTSPSLPPRAQHGSAGSVGTLRRGAPGRGSLREPARGGSGTALSLAPDSGMDLSSSTDGRQRFDPASNSSSCESVNSQEGLISQQSTPQQSQTAQQVAAAAVAARGRKELLEQRHQELLRKQRALQEQYARLQQLQRGGAATLAVVPPAGGATPDLLLLKKTGSESNLLAKMGLGAGLATMSGSLTHLASAPPSTTTPVPQPRTSVQQQQQQQQQQQEKPVASTSDTVPSTAAPATTTTPAMTGKIYETDIL